LETVVIIFISRCFDYAVVVRQLKNEFTFSLQNARAKADN